MFCRNQLYVPLLSVVDGPQSFFVCVGVCVCVCVCVSECVCVCVSVSVIPIGKCVSPVSASEVQLLPSSVLFIAQLLCCLFILLVQEGCVYVVGRLR